MADKKSFVLYNDNLKILDKLTDVQCGKLFRMIYAYQTGDTAALEALQEDLTLNLVFTPIEAQFERDSEKWLHTIERRREAGKKGGMQKAANLANASKCYQELANASKCKQDLANLAVNDNVNDNVNVNVNDINISVCDTRTREGITITDEDTIPSITGVAIEQLPTAVLTNAQAWCETFCMNNHISLEQLKQRLNDFLKTLQNYGETKKTIEDFKHHFASWYNLQKTNRNGNKTSIAETRRAATEARNAERMARIIKLAEATE